MSQPNDTPQAEWPDLPPAAVDAMCDYVTTSMSALLLGFPAEDQVTIAYQKLQIAIIDYWHKTAAAKIHARIADHLLASDDASTPGAADLARGRALGLVEALTILGGHR